MTPFQKLKWLAIEEARKVIISSADDYKDVVLDESPVTPENVDALYDAIYEGDTRVDWIDIDPREEIREGEFETDVAPDWSRHYESKSVGAKTPDGFVGWTYWSGGGKHGYPEDIEWMEDAYDLELIGERQVTVRDFKRKEEPNAAPNT